MREPKITMFYNSRLSPKRWSKHEPSQSPIKPRLLIHYLVQQGLLQHFITNEQWPPFTNEDFLIAHDPAYVKAFFAGVRPLCESNGLSWSRHFSKSVRYTNASLYHAIEYAILHPQFVSLSPTSGFHHAKIGSGSGYCTFAGQVISSLKIYEKYGLSGAYLDLDGHYGDSVKMAQGELPNVNLAVPSYANINPTGRHQGYIDSLLSHLDLLRTKVLNREISYVVFCHGADSHELDDYSGPCSTSEWLKCSEIVYWWVQSLDESLGSPLPLALSLFGGYRSGDYQSVLSLHTADLALCLEILLGQPVNFQVNVKERNWPKWPEGGEQWEQKKSR